MTFGKRETFKRVRISAKQVITKYVATAVLKLEVCGAGTEPIRQKLQVYHDLCVECSWLELAKRIERALKEHSPPVPFEPLAITGPPAARTDFRIFTED